MDYNEAHAAFFGGREGVVTTLDWATPARRLRDAIEPLATICFWSEPAYDEYAALGLDFLQGYVFSRACVLGDVEPTVASAAFGVFEPGLVADLFRSARETADVTQVRAAKERGAVTALRTCLGDPADLDGLAEVLAALRRASGAADPTGRALHAGLSALDWPEDPLGQLWHACTVLREHRGDGHLATLVAAGIDGVQANQLTELWVGWDALSYTGSRAWSPEAMDAGAGVLHERGWVADGQLTEAGRTFRGELEATTDRSVAPAVEAIGDDLDSGRRPARRLGPAGGRPRLVPARPLQARRRLAPTDSARRRRALGPGPGARRRRSLRVRGQP